MANYLIVGGSSGIGGATVDLLAEKGHHVKATYFENKKENTSSAEYLPFNVLNDDEFPALDWDRLDGLVYCPGSIQLKPFHRFSKQDFIQDLELQVLGAVQVIQNVLPKLKKSEQASIVLFSTIAVQRGFNFHSLVSTSKGAIEGLTRSLAAEFAPVIRVNAIAPSVTDTKLAERLLNSDERKETLANSHPLKSVGDAHNIAESVEYLLTPSSAWMTGQILHLDGGKSSIAG